MGAGACTTTTTTRRLGQLCVMLLPVDVWFFFAIYFINELRAEPPLIFNGLLIYAFAATVAAVHYASNMLQQPGNGGGGFFVVPALRAFSAQNGNNARQKFEDAFVIKDLCIFANGNWQL